MSSRFIVLIVFVFTTVLLTISFVIWDSYMYE